MYKAELKKGNKVIWSAEGEDMQFIKDETHEAIINYKIKLQRFSGISKAFTKVIYKDYELTTNFNLK